MVFSVFCGIGVVGVHACGGAWSLLVPGIFAKTHDINREDLGITHEHKGFLYDPVSSYESNYNRLLVTYL